MSVISFPLNRFLAAIAPPVAATVLVTFANPSCRFVPFPGQKEIELRAHDLSTIDSIHSLGVNATSDLLQLIVPSTDCFIAPGNVFSRTLFTRFIFRKIQICPQQSPSRTTLPLGGSNFGLRRRRLISRLIKGTSGGEKRHNDWHSLNERSLLCDSRWQIAGNRFLSREALDSRHKVESTPPQPSPLGSWQIGQESFSEIVGLESTPIPRDLSVTRPFASDRP